MANFVDCQLVTDANGQHCIVAVTNRPDGLHGCFYTLHQPRGGIVGVGDSSTGGASAAADAASAMKNGKAAAKRWLANTSKAIEPVHSVQLAQSARPTPSAQSLVMPAETQPRRPAPPAAAPASPAAVPAAKPARQCPREDLLFMFNSICIDLTPIKSWLIWSNERTNALQHIWSLHPDVEFWKAFFSRVHASDFLCARSTDPSMGKPWRATFDWIIQPEKLAKILSGAYDNRHGQRDSKLPPRAV